MITHLCANQLVLTCGPHAACERNEWLQNGHHRRVEHQNLRQWHAWQHGSWTYNFSFLFLLTVLAVIEKQPHPLFRWSKIVFLYNAPFIYMTNDSLTMLWPSGRFRKKLCWLFASFFRGTWPTSLCCVCIHEWRSCPRCLPQYSSNNLFPLSCFLCMRPYFLPFCFVNFAFCPAEMRVLLISQLKAFFPAAVEVQR